MKKIPKLLMALGVAGLTGFLVQGADFQNADVGFPAIEGSTEAPDGPGGLVTVTGAGADIWGTCDEFQFYWPTMDAGAD